MATLSTHRAPLAVFARVCEHCGHEAGYNCGNRVCGARYCSIECQRADWLNGHRKVCKRLLAWMPVVDDTEPVEGILDALRGRKKDEDESASRGPLGKLVDSYKVPEDKSTGVFSSLMTMINENKKPDATPPVVLQDTGDVKKMTASDKTKDASESAESSWKRTKGGAMTSILSEMKAITKDAKDRKFDSVKPLENIGDPLSSTELVKRFMTKVTLAGFKVTFAGAKVAAGAGAETATVVGIPLDTLIDAIATVLDVMIFAATVMESIYGIIRGFMEIKNHLVALLTFSGGPPGVQAAVDAIFNVLASVGLKNRAQQFMGSIVELFDRFVRWVAPVIGSVIGMVIPYDASITGRVIEFFLYPVKFFITQGWLLISKTWDLLPESWQQILVSRERWNELLISFVDILKRLFPVSADGETWKSRLIDKAGRVGVKIINVHPLVVVGVISKERADKSISNVFEAGKKVSTYVDTIVSRWIDDLVIPNIDKITVLVQAALGLGFGFIYMLHAYTPDGTRKKLGIQSALDTAVPVSQIIAHLAESRSARTAFACDPEARRRELLAIMQQQPPRSLDAMQYAVLCIEAGVSF